MKKQRFGRTGLEVSRIALGGIPITRVSLDNAVAIVKEAINSGINFIDTAHAYGDSEEKIGAAIQGMRRSDLVLASKSGARDAQTLTTHLDLSLKRLGVDYLDIFQLHNISVNSREQIFAPKGAFEGLVQAMQAGKVRFPAFSSHNVVLAVQIMKEGHFDAVQLPFNFIDTDAGHEAIPLAKELDMGFIAMKPLGGGLLNDAGLSFRYLLQFENIIPDPGIETLEEIREIVQIVEADQPLSDEDKAAIEKLRSELSDSWCRRCDYCQPCSQGIPISSVLKSKSLFRRFSAHAAQALMGKDMEKARSCIECLDCVPRCPYNLDIPALLKENIADWEARIPKPVS